RWNLDAVRKQHPVRRQEREMRNRTLATFAAMVIACLVASPTVAVTNGQPDGDGHPYVGVAIQFIPDMPGFVTVCSGSALSSTKFLTAAHCFDPADPVLFSSKYGPPF